MKKFGIFSFLLLLFSCSLLDITTPFSHPLALARRCKEILEIKSKLREALEELNYHDVQLVDSLLEVFPEIYKLKTLKDPIEKIKTLAFLIKSRISPKKGIFELSAVLKDRSANCLGYTQLVYILGRAVGLNIEAMLVFLHEGSKATDIVNLIKVGKDKFVILDLAYKEHNYYFLSPIFTWEETYEKKGELWYYKPERKGFKEMKKYYAYVLPIPREGILAAKLINEGRELEYQGEYLDAHMKYLEAQKLFPPIYRYWRYG